jgi:Arc/MetJ-type ribon-helix-helix transcriptional regulator
MTASTIKRTIQFVLLLNRFEMDALHRVVKAGGYRSASEALRYLIRREDPEAITSDMARTISLEIARKAEAR